MTELTRQLLSMFSGESRTLTFAVKDSAGVAQDLTAATIKFHISRDEGVAALITKSIGSGITVPTPTDGNIVVAMAASDTATICGELYFQVIVTDGSGNISVVAHGDLTILNTLTE